MEHVSYFILKIVNMLAVHYDKTSVIISEKIPKIKHTTRIINVGPNIKSQNLVNQQNKIICHNVNRESSFFSLFFCSLLSMLLNIKNKT